MAILGQFGLSLSLELFEFLNPCLMVDFHFLFRLTFLQNCLIFLQKVILWANKHEVFFVELNKFLALHAVFEVAEINMLVLWLFKGWEFGHPFLILSFECLFDFLRAHLLSFGHLVLNGNLVAELSLGHLVVLPLLEVLNFVSYSLLSSVVDFSIDPALLKLLKSDNFVSWLFH